LRRTFCTYGLPVFGLISDSITTSISDYTGVATVLDHSTSEYIFNFSG